MTTAESLENLLERVKSSSALESLAAAEQLATLPARLGWGTAPLEQVATLPAQLGWRTAPLAQRDAEATAAPLSHSMNADLRSLFEAYQEQIREVDQQLKAVTPGNQELAEAIRAAFGTSSGIQDAFERAVLGNAPSSRPNEDVLEAWRQFTSHQMRIHKQLAEAFTSASQKSLTNQVAEKVLPK